MTLVITLCTGLTSCELFMSGNDNPAPSPTPTPTPTPTPPTSTTIELTTAELTPEQKAQTEAQLIAVQQKGATIGITFSYKGIDYDASFEKTEGEDYKLTAFTSSQTSTIEETLKLASFTPYLTTLVPDNWTEEQIDEYYANIIDDEGDDDEGDDDEGDDDEGDDDEGDDDDSEYTDELIFTDFDSEDEEPAGTRAMTRATTSAALDMLFGLSTATDEDLVQVQINTVEATATIVGETDLFALKSLSASDATYATARTRAEKYRTKITIKIDKKGSKMIKSVSLRPSNLLLKGTGAKKIKAKIKPKGAKITKIVWKSNNQSVVKIAKNWKNKYSIKVKAQYSGETDIRVTVYSDFKKVSKSYKITVSIAVTSVILNETKLELTPSQTYQLTATVTPKEHVDQTVTWSSSDEKIAKVEDGVVTAVKAGTAKITAKAGDKTATCDVTVTEPVNSPSIDDPGDYGKGGDPIAN